MVRSTHVGLSTSALLSRRSAHCQLATKNNSGKSRNLPCRPEQDPTAELLEVYHNWWKSRGRGHRSFLLGPIWSELGPLCVMLRPNCGI